MPDTPFQYGVIDNRAVSEDDDFPLNAFDERCIALERAKHKCPRDQQHGEIVCRDGVLWALTYSEMGPPDSRQWWGDCDWEGHKPPDHPCPVTGKGECKVKLCKEGCFLRDQLGYGEK